MFKNLVLAHICIFCKYRSLNVALNTIFLPIFGLEMLYFIKIKANLLFPSRHIQWATISRMVVQEKNSDKNLVTSLKVKLILPEPLI
jgi:hypothetical protein